MSTVFNKVIYDLLKKIKICIIILLTSISPFLLFEVFLRLTKDYTTDVIQEETCKIIDKRGFGGYKNNCVVLIRNWESQKLVEYKFNNFGRRDGIQINNNSSNSTIAFIGDSFTMGAMVPIEDNYNYYAIKNLRGKSYLMHNYGVGGEQVRNITNKLKSLDFSNYKYIVYGLTPNDLFDYLIKKDDINSSKKVLVKQKETILYKYRKLFSKYSYTYKFILKNLLSNDRYYYSIYRTRLPYSGYLDKKMNDNWLDAFSQLENDLKTLPAEIKAKLKIFLLPQRAEIVAERLGIRSYEFEAYYQHVCNKLQIDCKSANVAKMSKLEESHFPIDGHLTIEGNHSAGEDLIEWMKDWQ